MNGTQFIKLFLVSLLILIAASTGCKKINTPPEEDNLSVPEGFDYNTTRTVTVRFEAFSPNGTPLRAVRCNVFDSGYDENNQLGQLITSGFTNAQGIFETVFSVPAVKDSVFLQIDFIGMLNSSMASVKSGNIVFVLGQGVQGQNYTSDGYVPKDFPYNLFKTTTPSIQFMGTWNKNGKPSYLEPVRDELSTEFLTAINLSLPERVRLPNVHPEFLASGNETNLVLRKNASVWVTFVHEGAGYKNVLAYYTYPSDNPPQSVDDIDHFTVVYPNVSIYRSKILLPGDKVYLGEFPENTTIGWAIFANGYNDYTDKVTTGNWIIYSDPELNDTPAEKQQHMVLLRDLLTNNLVMGFEDIKRDKGSDEDFNDAVFYAVVDPPDAVGGYIPPTINNDPDCDNDGIPDYLDEFPCSPDSALTIYDPAPGVFYTLAFEDGWPTLGDEDYNDMIVDYNFKKIVNANNDVVTLDGNIVLRAGGTLKSNMFGIQFDNLSPSDISSVSGTKIYGSSLNIAANGTENNQSRAVVMIFDDSRLVQIPPGSQYMVNSQKGVPYVDPDTMNVVIKFAPPVSQLDLGVAPYNPFLVADGDRGKEVHQSGWIPTDLVNNALFNTEDDATQFNNGRYYRTKDNMAWVLNVATTWDYPFEGVYVRDAYTQYFGWIQSGGTGNQDWYLKSRVEELIYKPYGISKRR
jgi:LruC domain-containing protein